MGRLGITESSRLIRKTSVDYSELAMKNESSLVVYECEKITTNVEGKVKEFQFPSTLGRTENNVPV